MRCNARRSWNSLPPAEKRDLQELIQEQVYMLADRENEKVQEVIIKLQCIWMKDRGATDEEIFAYIAWQRRAYRQLARFKTEEEQQAWLEQELTKRFQDGFPQMRIDDMKSKERTEIDI